MGDWRDAIVTVAKSTGTYGLLKEAQWRVSAPANRGWTRVTTVRETEAFLKKLPYAQMSALEISGTDWAGFGFKSYRKVGYPQFDICQDVLEEQFDIIIAEQVFEHLLWPYRAGRNICQMLKPGGWFLITTPFMIKVHASPIDCSRWTELGMRHFLAECGFDLDAITTGAWGNRACVRRCMKPSWPSYQFWRHSLRNEPETPVTIWAFAQKPAAESRAAA